MKSSRFLIKFILISLCLLTIINVYAQQRPGNKAGSGFPGIILKAKVIDAISDQTLEYATVSAFSLKDSSLVGGTITDNLGAFELLVKTPRAFIRVEYLGMETQDLSFQPERGMRIIDLGIVRMSANAEVLQDVEIRAEKSESQFFLDKQVFNVGKDLVNKGGSAEDILDNVPSVSVDIDGVVSLRGNSGVKMLVDGKPSGLIGSDNTGLRSIPANLIDRIEVVTNPSARYEAEGVAGIINIILKKNEAGGFHGSFDLITGFPLQAGIGANINYRKNKFNWFLNYGLNYREGVGGGFIYQERLLTDDLIISDIDRDVERASLSNSIRFGADYFFTDKEQLTGAFLYKRADEDNLQTTLYNDYFDFGGSDLLELTEEERAEVLTPDKLSSHTTRTDDEIEDERNLEYSLNYTRELSNKDHKFNALIQFTDRSETEESDFVETLFNRESLPLNELIQRSNNDEGNKTWLFQADYVHAYSRNHKWEVGLRSSLREIENVFLVEENIDDTWVPLEGLNNDFIYDEDIHAAYLIYGNTYNKFSFQLGSRLEYADISTELKANDQNGINARDFLNLFPSGHLNYKLSDANAVQVSYSRRVRRPRFWDLNPFFTFADSRNFFSGNPNVNPQYTDSYELSNINFWDNMSLTLSLFYRKTQESIQRVSFYDTDNLSTITVPLNLSDADDSGLDINISHSAVKWLRLDANLSLYNNKTSIDQAAVRDEIVDYFFIVRSFTGTEEELFSRYDFEVNETENFLWNGRLTARFKFLDSDLQLRGRFRSAFDSAQGRTKAMATMDIGWSKDITNDFTLTLSGRDIFNSRRRRRITEFNNFFSEVDFQWRSRSITLTANYRINQKKKRGRPSGGFEGGGEQF